MKAIKLISTVLFLLILSPCFSQRITYSTYLGGSKLESKGWLKRFAVDDSGAVSFTVSTNSTNFPVTDNAYDKTFNGGEVDIALVQFNIKQNKLNYSTYFGGTSINEYASQVLVQNNKIYLVGNAGVSNFPVTNNAFDKTFNGPATQHADGFIARFDAAQLGYSTFVGTSGDVESISNLFVNPDGEMIAVGTIRNWNELSITHRFSNEKLTDNPNVCVIRFNATGDSILSTTLLGPTFTGLDAIRDSEGNIYLTGTTPSRNFPVTPEAFDTSYNGGGNFWEGDIFVTKLSPTGDQMLFSTFLGGSGNENSPSICLDNSNNILVSGCTPSNDFPTTSNALDATRNGTQDYFISKLSNDGRDLLYSTYLGGNEKTWFAEMNGKILCSKKGAVYLCGFTDATDYPTTSNALYSSNKGGADIVISMLDSTLTQLKYSTYLGGTGNDYCNMELDPAGNLILLGETNSTDFPVTSGCYDQTFNGGSSDAFLIKIELDTITGNTVSIVQKPMIFTNPVKDYITLENLNTDFQNQPYSITDMLGKTVRQGLLNGELLSVTGLNHGLYFLQLNGREGKWQEKFLIE
jgi:hypothetical protein